jgi:hypothetical protein
LVKVSNRRERLALQPAAKKLHLRGVALTAKPSFGWKCDERREQQNHAGELHATRSRFNHMLRTKRPGNDKVVVLL